MRQLGKTGRWFVVAAALLAVVVVSGCGGPPRSSGSGVFTVEIVTHVVSEGETLASIADDYYGDPSGASYLAGVNGVDDAFQLNPGMLVEVPVGEEDIARYAVRTDAKARYNRGIAFATGGELRKAADEFGAALKQDPRFADAGYNLGVVLLMMGEPEASARVLEQVIEVRAGDALQEFALGKAYFDAGRVADAIERFDAAIALDPGLEDAVFARAVALLESGEIENGIVALDGYVRRFPSGHWAEVARARLIELAGSAAAARKIVAEAMAREHMPLGALEKTDHRSEPGGDVQEESP
jgi:tetratricopeptide (TPR) repeat protein